jgi:hypothetical protein
MALRRAGQRFDAICTSIQGIVGVDIGARGIIHITLPMQLQPAALNFVIAPSVIVLTGFPCRISASTPTETDGPPGAAALAAAASKLGKTTAIATDDSSAAVLRACISVWSGLASVQLIAFPPSAAWTASDSSRFEDAAVTFYHAVAIERAGRSADGSYRTMRGISMDALVAPIDELLTRNCACSDIGGATMPLRTSTGIGDGGNECGMGLVHASCAAHIPLGASIGCVVPCDALITAGVSNWGGWGLVAAAEALVRLSVSAEVQREVDAGTAGARGPGEAAVESVARILKKGHGATTAIDVTAFERVASLAPGCLLPTSTMEETLAVAMNAAGARELIWACVVIGPAHVAPLLQNTTNYRGYGRNHWHGRW